MNSARSYHVPSGTTRREAVDRVVNVLDKLPRDRAWTVEVKEFKTLRSNAQNRYLRGVVYPEILTQSGLKDNGWDDDDVHEFLLGEWSGWEVCEAFGRKRMKPIRRSSKLNKQEFSDYIDWITRWAADKGIVIPDAGSLANDW